MNDAQANPDGSTPGSDGSLVPHGDGAIDGASGDANPIVNPMDMSTTGCTEQATRCGTANDVQQCQSNTWVTTQVCPFGCAQGACAAATQCTAGAYSCFGNDVGICNSSGTAFLFGALCPNGCTNGLCTGGCTPGAARCNGSNLETCAMDGMTWTSAPCASGCDSGQCVLARLDVTMDMDMNGLVIVNGPVNVFAGATLHSSQGDLTIRAKSITVDAMGSIAAAPTGMTPDGAGQSGAYCNDIYQSHSGGGGGGYGTGGYGGVEIGDTCGGFGGPAFGSQYDSTVSSGSPGGSETNGGTPGGAGGGVLRLIAPSITISGTVSADGAPGSGSGLGSGGGSGGGILIAADQLTIGGTVSANFGTGPNGSGNGQGGVGRVKLLWGASHTISGTIIGVQSTSVMPPLDPSSLTQPDQSLYYNDDFPQMALGWTPPFPSHQGYYWLLDGTPVNPPTAANGTFDMIETLSIPRAMLMAGDNYVHLVTIDSMANLGTVESTFHLRLNTTPPSVMSASHPDPTVWSTNVNPYFSWTLPNGDANYSGVYYVFDHYGTTVPTRADTFIPVAQHQLLRSNVAPGIWAFHLVSVDQAGNLTQQASHYQVRIGADPGSGQLIGQVSSAMGSVANATVALNRGLVSNQQTNSTGTYDFASLPAGTWELAVSAMGYKTSTQMVTITPNATTTANVMLSP